MGPERRSIASLGLFVFPLLLIAIGLFSDGVGPWAALDSDRAVASTTVLDPAEVSRGFPVMSLWVEPDDLHDPVTGILANVRAHGRAWERTGALSYLDGGELRFASSVGVRVHGGGSRITSEVQSFRVYFRDEYGADAFGPGLLFDGTSDPLQRLILHNDVRRGSLPRSMARRGLAFWSFSNPLAYDIAERIGAIVPRTKPVRFFLNGKWQGVYVATEYVGVPDNPGFFHAHFGHAQFSSDLAPMEELWAWLEELESPLTMQTISERINVENMTRWFLSVVFCATGDAFQGPGQFRDETRQRGEWFWINWDMDQSFRLQSADSFYSLLEQPGQRRRGRRHSEPRAAVLTHMLREDPEYLDYFKREFARMLNQQVTPEFLDERYRYYEEVARSYGVEDLGYLEALREFFSKRHDVLWELAHQHFDTGAAVALRVIAPPGGVLVDGSGVGGTFDGRYFPDMMLDLSVPANQPVSHWMVNGERQENAAQTIRLRVSEDLVIEPVLR